MRVSHNVPGWYKKYRKREFLNNKNQRKELGVMFSLARFKQHSFHDSVITKCRNRNSWSSIQGEFSEDEIERSDCKYFLVSFYSADSRFPEMDDAEIISFEINERGGVKKGYSVRICVENNGFITVEFGCKLVFFSVYKYKGMSYRNVYGTAEYDTIMEDQKYVLDETYLTEKEHLDLPEGFALDTETYREFTTFLKKCTIRRDAQAVYDYLCTYTHVKPFCEFIYHRNGHRYYPFHIGMHGISYIDVDTLEVYNYLPEGYAHDIDSLLGTSFVITDIHYDRESGLIAYGGYLWEEGPRNVMVGDFSCLPNCGYPLEDMQALIDPDYEKYGELDFESWGGGKLSLKCGEMSVSVDVDEIKRLLKSHAGAP